MLISNKLQETTILVDGLKIVEKPHIIYYTITIPWFFYQPALLPQSTKLLRWASFTLAISSEQLMASGANEMALWSRIGCWEEKPNITVRGILSTRAIPYTCTVDKTCYEEATWKMPTWSYLIQKRTSKQSRRRAQCLKWSSLLSCLSTWRNK